MEKYAYNLEEIIEERTQQLVEEKTTHLSSPVVNDPGVSRCTRVTQLVEEQKKTDRLLYRMLPSYVTYYYRDVPGIRFRLQEKRYQVPYTI